MRKLIVGADVMKKKYILIFTIILISLLVSGSTMAWFTHSISTSNEFIMGTVQVEVLDFQFKDISNSEIGKEYQTEIKVVSRGSKDTYVRVRLIPQWKNEPSLPIPNVEVELGDDPYWVKAEDDYFYYSSYLTKGQQTEPLVVNIIFDKSEACHKHKNQKFTLKVVAEGVQTNEKALQNVWGIDKLPLSH